MKRFSPNIVITCVFSFAIVHQANAEDEVTYYNHNSNKEIKVIGTIESETPSHIEIKPASGSSKEIAVIDIVDVVYNVPLLIKQDYRKAIAREAAADKATREEDRSIALEAALKLYQALVDKVTDARAKRHFEFKVAQLMAIQAKDQPDLADKAMEKLANFKKDYPKSWQLSRSVELLAQLLMEKKDWEGALKAFEEMADTPGIAADTKVQWNVKIADVLVRSKKFSEAEQKLQDLVKALPPESPHAVRLQVSLAKCEAASGKSDQGIKRIETVLAKATDPEIKAEAYNTLGDCHRATKRTKDALWDYLWVDVIYHQNRSEHAKALYYLSQLFKELKDDARAKQFREKLADKQFAGQEYQRLATAEK